MIDDIDYSSDLDVCGDDINTYDSFDGSSNVETSCYQEDYSFIDSASVLGDYSNGMVSPLELETSASLYTDTMDYDSHLDGAMRGSVTEARVPIANDNIEQSGIQPTFSDCIDHFQQTDLCIHTSGEMLEPIDLGLEGSNEVSFQSDAPEDSTEISLSSNDGTSFEDGTSIYDPAIGRQDEFPNPTESIDSHDSNQANPHGYQVSFGGYKEDSRDAAASKLQDKLSTYHIYYPGSLSSSDTWGGWDNLTGEKIKRAIKEARNEGRISDSKFIELMEDLKNACYYIS